VTYFTSSKHVQKARETYGDPEIKQVRKIFKDSISARKWEARVLKRLCAVQRSDFLNKTDSDLSFFHNPNYRWYNNGVENTLSDVLPGVGWVLGRINQKATTSGGSWYNNGTIHKIFKEPPSSEWIKGYLPSRNKKISQTLTKRVFSEAHRKKNSESQKRLSKKYVFQHNTFGIFEGSTGDLRRNYPEQNLYRSGIHALLIGKISEFKGWRITKTL
jgi:hypothetical protein